MKNIIFSLLFIFSCNKFIETWSNRKLPAPIPTQIETTPIAVKPENQPYFLLHRHKQISINPQLVIKNPDKHHADWLRMDFRIEKGQGELMRVKDSQEKFISHSQVTPQDKWVCLPSCSGEHCISLWYYDDLGAEKKAHCTFLYQRPNRLPRRAWKNRLNARSIVKQPPGRIRFISARRRCKFKRPIRKNAFTIGRRNIQPSNFRGLAGICQRVCKVFRPPRHIVSLSGRRTKQARNDQIITTKTN